MRTERALSICLLFFLLFASLANAESNNGTEEIKVYEFYAQGCIHCAAVERHLINLEREYSFLHVERFEMTHSYENLVLGKKFCTAYGLNCSQNVPTPILFVNDTYFIGDKPILENLKPIILLCESHGCEDAAKRVEGVSSEQLHAEPPLAVVILAAMVDSINPCAFALLIFMLQYVGSIASRRKMINIGLIYIAVVYVTYMLAGLGILTAFQSLSTTELVYNIAAVVSIVAGLINIKDYFFYGKWISLEIPKKHGKRIESYVKQATFPAAVALGILVSAVELPCTGGAYLAILAMLQWAPFWRAFAYLALYNFFFVLPLIAILLLFTQGYSAEALENMRLEKRRYMRLGIGLLLVFLGIGMLLGWFTGGFWST